MMDARFWSTLSWIIGLIMFATYFFTLDMFFMAAGATFWAISAKIDANA